MNFFPTRSISKISQFRVGLLLLLLGLSGLSNAQSVLFDDQARIQSGTIEKTREDDGYITISGWDYGFDGEITKVFYDGEETGVEKLASGFSVRYTVDGNNTLLKIEIIESQDGIASREKS